MRINEIKVRRSMWVPIPTVLLILFIAALTDRPIDSSFSAIGEALILASGIMLIGIIVWGPSALLCVWLEKNAINEDMTKSSLKALLFFEALIPALIFNAITFRSGSEGVAMVFFSLFTALFAQMVRWFYINRKEGLYVIEPESDPQIIQMNNQISQ